MTRKMKSYGMSGAGYAIGVKAEDVCSNLARIRGVLEKELGKDVGITNTLRSCIAAWYDSHSVTPVSVTDHDVDSKLLARYENYGISIIQARRVGPSRSRRGSNG